MKLSPKAKTVPLKAMSDFQGCLKCKRFVHSNRVSLSYSVDVDRPVYICDMRKAHLPWFILCLLFAGKQIPRQKYMLTNHEDGNA